MSLCAACLMKWKINYNWDVGGGRSLITRSVTPVSDPLIVEWKVWMIRRFNVNDLSHLCEAVSSKIPFSTSSCHPLFSHVIQWKDGLYKYLISCTCPLRDNGMNQILEQAATSLLFSTKMLLLNLELGYIELFNIQTSFIFNVDYWRESLNGWAKLYLLWLNCN